jgi:hypothetical protein
VKNFAVTVLLTASVFSVLGGWLSDELGMIAVEVGLNSGGGKALDYLAIALLGLLVVPFLFVLDLSPLPRVLFFALNGACWACLCWAMWKIWHGAVHGKGQRSQK